MGLTRGTDPNGPPPSPQGRMAKADAAQPVYIEERKRWTPLSSTLIQVPATIRLSAAVFAIAAASVPFASGEATVYVLNVAIVDAIAILGVSVLFRYTGLITIGQAAVQAVGAYTCAITISHWGVPIVGAIFLGGVAGGIVGIVVAAASVRLTGLYFAVLTLGLGGFVSSLILLLPQLTGGSGGLSAPSFAIFGLTTGASTFWLSLLVLGVVVAGLHIFNRTKFAKCLLLAKGRVPAAKSIGGNVVALRLATATVCNVLAGISGGLLVITAGFASTNSFTFAQSILMLAGAIIGGTVSLWGAIVGGLVMVEVPHLLAGSPELGVFILGGGMVLILAAKPSGLVSLGVELRDRMRRKERDRTNEMSDR